MVFVELKNPKLWKWEWHCWWC